MYKPTPKITVAIAALLTALWAASAVAADQPRPVSPRAADAKAIAASDTQPVKSEDTEPIIYVPPKGVGAPDSNVRIGGATRGGELAQTVEFGILAPRTTGWTATPQPTLYWYLSAPVDNPIDIVIIGADAVEPLLELTVRSPPPALHHLDLAAHGVSLEADTEYMVYAVVVPDYDHRSRDIISQASMRYLRPAPELIIAGAEPMARAIAFAQNGYWYDALTALLENGSAAGRSGSSNRAVAAKQLLLDQGLDAPTLISSRVVE